MAHFIELHKRDNQQVLLNVDWIVKISPSNDETKICLGVPQSTGSNNHLLTYFQTISVIESYSAIKDMLL